MQVDVLENKDRYRLTCRMYMEHLKIQAGFGFVVIRNKESVVILIHRESDEKYICQNAEEMKKRGKAIKSTLVFFMKTEYKLILLKHF